MNQSSSKIILDLCGGTGAWSKPYRDAGYDVRLITLPDYDVCAYSPPDEVYGILAAPPCTEFSLAKGARSRDFAGAMSVVRACLEIIWHCRINGGLKFWALENPVGFLRQFLGRPPYTFKQWQFGDRGLKPTDLWGYYNPPIKTCTIRPDDLVKRYKSGKVNTLCWAAPEYAKEYAHLNLDRAALRAITPPGFAEAFYKANK